MCAVVERRRAADAGARAGPHLDAEHDERREGVPQGAPHGAQHGRLGPAGLIFGLPHAGDEEHGEQQHRLRDARAECVVLPLQVEHVLAQHCMHAAVCLCGEGAGRRCGCIRRPMHEGGRAAGKRCHGALAVEEMWFCEATVRRRCRERQ